MFHQIRVPKQDRELFRFVWWENGSTEGKLKDYRMAAHLFGSVSSSACANFVLRRTADDNQSNFSPLAIQTVHQNFYVDDLLMSVPSTEEARSLIKEIGELLLLGGFSIKKWVSNDRKVIEAIPKSDLSKNFMNLDLAIDKLPKQRALGLQWDVEKDSLFFRIKVKEKPATKRGVLSVVNSIFDPLGFGIPVSVPVKILFQDLCRLKLGWDDPIPADFKF